MELKFELKCNWHLEDAIEFDAVQPNQSVYSKNNMIVRARSSVFIFTAILATYSKRYVSPPTNEA